jgi:hypothetical protein
MEKTVGIVAVTALAAIAADLPANASGRGDQGLAVAAGLEAQQQAVGKDQTAIINAVKALAAGTQRFMPQNLALTIGGEGGSALPH